MLTEKVRWVARDDAGGGEGELFSIWQHIPGGHKWLHYFAVYEETLLSKRGFPIRLLEIGVQKGASLELWRRILHPDSVIVGIDVDEACSQVARPNEGVHVRIGRQQDAVFLSGVVEEFGPFDVIIDDGSHLSSHQIASFIELFPTGLARDGVYIVEDLHASYWSWGRDSPISFLELAFHMVDVMHRHYKLGKDEVRFRLGEKRRITEFRVPRLTTMVRSIHFYDSMVVVEKQADRPVPATFLH